MYKAFKTRDGRLKYKIQQELQKPAPNVDEIFKSVVEYEEDNLKTIKKLKRVRKVDADKINSGLKETINAHGPITKELIGSCTKRILGMMLTNEITPKVDNRIPLRPVLISLGIGFIVGLLVMI
jgi:ElaB/YqjD/DUF883 family membrane-anchored ribosome-binding protein